MEVGSPVHYGTKEILDRHNISTEGMKARKLLMMILILTIF